MAEILDIRCSVRAGPFLLHRGNLLGRFGFSFSWFFCRFFSSFLTASEIIGEGLDHFFRGNTLFGGLGQDLFRSSHIFFGDIFTAAGLHLFDSSLEDSFGLNTLRFGLGNHFIRRSQDVIRSNFNAEIGGSVRSHFIDTSHQIAGSSFGTSKVSNGLMSADDLKRVFDPHFHVETVVSNRHMYQVSGVKQDLLAHCHGGMTHSHGDLTHCHTHAAADHNHLPAENATPLEELLVMMRYLVSHNDAHAQEVANLAGELMAAGKNSAYDEIMDAVSDFDMVNAKLAAILNKLADEEE